MTGVRPEEFETEGDEGRDPPLHVHWREGLFLRPHHFQLLEDGMSENVARQLALTLPYRWGVVRIEIDAAKLKAEPAELEIRKLELVLPSGRVAVVGGGANARVQSRAVPQRSERRLRVHVGLRRVRQQEPNVGEPGEDEGNPPRHLRSVRVVTDRITGGNPVEVEVEQLNLRVFFDGESTAEFETLPVAELTAAPGSPLNQVSRTYAPPSVRLGGAPVLRALVRELHVSTASRADDLARATDLTALTASDATGADLLRLLRLEVLRGALPLLREASERGAFHPYETYVAICEYHARLATLVAGRAAPNPPVYDHLDAADGYRRVVGELLEMLAGLVDERETFVRIPLRRITLPIGGPAFAAEDLKLEWFAEKHALYLAFTSPELAAKGGDWYRAGVIKAAAPSRIEEVARQALYGVEAVPCERPRALPPLAHAVYYRLEGRNPSRPQVRAEWDLVVKHRALAIHFASEGRRAAGMHEDPGIEAYVVFGR